MLLTSDCGGLSNNCNYSSQHLLVMMIVFITFNSSLVPLIEGLSKFKFMGV